MEMVEMLHELAISSSELMLALLPIVMMKLIGAVLLVFLWPKFVRAFVRCLKNAMLKRNLEELLVSFVESLMTVLGYVILFFLVISILGVKTTSLVALLGTAGLAVGLALQGSLSNLAGGVIILFFRQFKKGDYIASVSAGVEGTVSNIQILYTSLTTPNNQVIVIPNSQLANGTIINYSKLEERRLDLTFSCSYDDDIDKVIAKLHEVAKAQKGILQDRPITIRLKTQNASSLDFVFRGYTKQEDYWDTLFSCNEMVKKEFDKAGIEIPYNKLDVYSK